MDAARSLDNVAIALPASIYVFAIIAELLGKRGCNRPVKHRNFSGPEMRGTRPPGTARAKGLLNRYARTKKRAASIGVATTVVAFGQGNGIVRAAKGERARHTR